jgi:hypothetical protein
MLTNRLGLPQAIVNAVRNDPYTIGASNISVTSLIQPPHQRQLRLANEVVEDASDRIWSLVGQIGHSIIERSYPAAMTDEAANLTPAECLAKFGVVAERRLFTECNGWTVSGQFDVIEREERGESCLQDFKFTSVWTVKDGIKVEWERQLNLLRLLALRHGIVANRLRIIAILRDWSKGKAKQPEYPSQQVVPIDIPVWPIDMTEDYMLERVKAHQDPNPPLCTDEERWKREDIWAVMKDGRKSAVKLHYQRDSADKHCSELGKGHYIETRAGEYHRCMEYCNVMHVCPAMKTDF